MHVVIASKGPVAVGALSRTRCQPFFNTILAEHMATGFDCSIFEVATTNSTQGERLDVSN